jgi:tRNA-dihydrouridine synthase B
VLANGNVSSVSTAMAVLSQTQAAGVMIGRSAIRNPWIFSQIRAALSGQAISVVTLEQVREYIDRLYRMPTAQAVPEKSRISHLKMYLNYIGQSVDAAGEFLREMRRAKTEVELFGICDRYLLTNPQQLFSPEPYPDIFARPNCET